MTPICSISIDLDSIDCYFRIHALGPSPRHLRHLIGSTCLARFLEILERHDVRATFFVVGEDVDPDDEATSVVRHELHRASEQGHELANHSFSHPYDLGRCAPERVMDEIDRAHESISRLSDGKVVGFRAPGYGTSATIQQCLLERQYEYDSSILASPPYYLAKASVLAAMKMVRARSAAIMTDPRVLLAPTHPFRVATGAPWRPGHERLLQLPVAMTRWTRIPLIGTYVLAGPRVVRAALNASMRRRPFLNIVLHGIDLADAAADRLPRNLIRRQPELRTSLADRAARFDQLIAALRKTHQLMPLRDAAAIIRDAPSGRSSSP